MSNIKPICQITTNRDDFLTGRPASLFAANTMQIGFTQKIGIKCIWRDLSEDGPTLVSLVDDQGKHGKTGVKNETEYNRGQKTISC